MACWQDFVDSASEFGERVEALFTWRKHHTSQGVDPTEGNPGGWSGEAKLSGHAVELAVGAEQTSDRFRIEIADVVLTHVGTPANHLVIERWSPDAGLVRRERH